MAQQGAQASTYEVDDDLDAIELYFEKGVTDGLPVVPPTEERVQRMLNGTPRAAVEVIALIPPNYGEATVEKIAVNAVMAGCKPEYLPVILAGVEAMCDERVSLHGVQGTTHTSTPLFIVNGPIRKQLDINCAAGVFGSGWRANATIGRALRLLMMNVGGARPGEIDKSCMGHPGQIFVSHWRVRRGEPVGAVARGARICSRAEHDQCLLLRRTAVSDQQCRPHGCQYLEDDRGCYGYRMERQDHAGR